MVMEIIGLTTLAITAGLATAWYLSQIRNTMVRLKEETDMAYKVACSAEAELLANKEVRTLRQHNDELTSEVYTYKLGEASAHEDLKIMTEKADEHLFRCNELEVRLKNMDDARSDIEGHYKKLRNEFGNFKEDQIVTIKALNRTVTHLENKLFCTEDSKKNITAGYTRLQDEKKELVLKLRKKDSELYAMRKDNEKLENKSEEHLKELSGTRMILNTANDKIQQLTDELSDNQEELATTRIQLDRTKKVNEKLNADLDDWESMDDNTDLTPNNPNHSKHPNWHKSKAQGINRVHWHTVASACRTHFEAIFLKDKDISKAEIRKRFYLAQEGINTLEAGRKK